MMQLLTEPDIREHYSKLAGTDDENNSAPRIVGVGTALPEHSYSQRELLSEFAITDERVRSIFLNSAIERRFLTLPPRGPDGARRTETQGELLAKHTAQGTALGSAALRSCLAATGATLADVRYLCCVTSTGLLTPGFSALLIAELGLDRHTGRLDVVGMGCNAGLNGLAAVTNWASAHPGELAVLLCVEVCSAAYVFDGTMRTSVVNSLFGDGAAVVSLVASQHPASGTGGIGPVAPTVLRFASCLIPEAIRAMRYDWDDEAGKFSFFLDRDVPYVVGAHAELAVSRLLAGTGVRRSDIGHWVVHSGGKKVIDSVQINLGLTRHDLRHTTSVLRDYGNLSSGSFLFSYQRLLAENVVNAGDYGMFMTMGPGSTIETALVRF